MADPRDASNERTEDGVMVGARVAVNKRQPDYEGETGEVVAINNNDLCLVRLHVPHRLRTHRGSQRIVALYPYEFKVI